MYIKRYSNFKNNWSRKIKEIYSDVKGKSIDIINSMSDSEKNELIEFLNKRGLDIDLVERITNKLDLDKKELSDELAKDLVGFSNLKENFLNENFKDSFVRWIGLPGLSSFFTWVTFTLSKSNEFENKWIKKIYDTIPKDLSDSLIFIFMVLAIVFIIKTIIKLGFNKPFEDGI